MWVCSFACFACLLLGLFEINYFLVRVCLYVCVYVCVCVCLHACAHVFHLPTCLRAWHSACTARLITAAPCKASDLAPSISTVGPQVPVSSWGRLCAASPYAEFAAGGSTPIVASAVARFDPHVAMAVDWSALPLYRSLMQQLQQLPVAAARVPLIYLNYRVFSRTATGTDLELISG